MMRGIGEIMKLNEIKGMAVGGGKTYYTSDIVNCVGRLHWVGLEGSHIWVIVLMNNVVRARHDL